MAYEMLQVIELPVYHHEAEFSVCLLELSWLIYYVKSVLPWGTLEHENNTIISTIKKSKLAVHGTAPEYLRDLCWSNAEDTARSRLCSAAPGDLSGFHVRRPTLVITHLQSLGQHHGTDYQQQSGHLILFRISRTNWKLTFSDGPFLFLFHLERGRRWIGLHVTAPKKLTYTVNHKKGGSTFVTITLENLDRFL